MKRGGGRFQNTWTGFITIPWLEEAYRKDADNYKKIAEGLNKAGGLAKEGGLKLAYHNHDFEFATIDGQTGFDILTQKYGRQTGAL